MHSLVEQSAKPWDRRTLLALLFAMNLLNYIDRLTISGLLEPIGKDLHLNDSQLGQVAFAFLIPYSILPPVVGWIGDRAYRSRLTALAVFVWSIATAGAGAARNLIQLVATRATVGVGEATYMTLSPSLIADAFPPGKRGAAMSLFYTASPVGAALGVFLGGATASAYGWRAACLMVGLPGVLMAVAAWLYPEPKRGGLDPGQQAERPPLGQALRTLLANRAFLLLTAAYTLQLFAYNPIEFWLPTILQRDKGIPLMQANSIYGAIVVTSGIAGPLLGGILADRFSQRSSVIYYRICMLASFASVPPIVAILMLPRGGFLYGAIFSEVFLANMSTGLVFTILVAIVMPGLRATATALLLTTIHVFGDAISEPLIGNISNTLKQVVATNMGSGFNWLPMAARSGHLVIAMCCVTAPAMALSGIFYMMARPKSTN